MQAIVFDLDGVLVDSRAAVAAALAGALESRGHPAPSAGDVEIFIGPPIHHALSAILGVSREDPEIAACVEAYRERYVATYLDATPVFAGIPEVVAELAGRMPLAVATSKPAAFAVPLLEHHDLRRHFEVVEGPSLAPEPESKLVTLGRALDALGRPQATMVGDRRYDIEAAHAHGIHAIGVTWGIGTEHELRTAGADLIVHAPTDLTTTTNRTTTNRGQTS